MSKRTRRSRVNAKGRSDGNRDFVLLQWWLLRCPAFRSLSGNAVKVLLGIWDQHKGRTHNGNIGYAVRDGAAIGLSKSETSRALEELVAKGFLVITREAAFGTKRISRRWRLTAEPTADGPATTEFMSWAGPAPAVDKSPKARARREPVAHDKPIRPAARIFDSPARGTHSPARGTMGGAGRTSEAATVPPAGLCDAGPPALQSRGRDSLKSTTLRVVSGEAEGLSPGGGSDWPCEHVENRAPPDDGASAGGRRPPPDPELAAVFSKGQPEFGRAVAELRERRRLSIDAFAERVGLQPESWRRVEEAGVTPTRMVKQKARAVLSEMNGTPLPGGAGTGEGGVAR